MMRSLAAASGVWARSRPAANARVVSVHSSVFSHFSQDRSLNHRPIFKERRSDALAEWRQLCAG